MKQIARGAEAVIYFKSSKSTIVKRRIKRSYRTTKLDEFLRKTRTKREAKLISLARRAGVPTPLIKDVDIDRASIELEYIEGKKIRDVLEEADDEKIEELCEEIGRLVGKMHAHHIIHGDLTTSNMILSSNGGIYFIDFGLGEINKSIEAKGVDLLVFKKTLHSTHYKNEDRCWSAFIRGYSAEVENWREIIRRSECIEKRGRYFRARG